MLNDHHDGATMTDESNTISVAAVALPSSHGQASFRAQAVLAGNGIDLAALGSTDRTGAAPLAVELIGSLTGGSLAAHSAAGGGVAFLFRYGAVVFFDAAPAGITEYLRQIGPHIRQPFPQVERETEVLDIRLDPAGKETIERNTLVLADGSLHKLQLVADVMAKSVSLAHHEKGIERQFERIEPFAVNLDHWGRGGRAARELLHNLGVALLAEHRVVAGTRVDDSPELLWDHPELERLWARLRDEFEIRERFAALHSKLNLISRTAETALELLQNRRALRVEWAIVGLIVFEIALTLVQWALGVGH
jgi:required for meiotic nuclear division protein 1